MAHEINEYPEGFNTGLVTPEGEIVDAIDTTRFGQPVSPALQEWRDAMRRVSAMPDDTPRAKAEIARVVAEARRRLHEAAWQAGQP